MMKNLVIVLVYFLLMTACNSTEKNKGDGEHSANRHMNKAAFEDLVSKFEDSSRVEWQKPELVIEKLGNIEGKTIADIGAGTGYFSFRMAEKGANVIALDADERFLKYIDEKNKNSGVNNVETRKTPYEKPELDSASVDAILIVNTYHHIENREKYFKKVLSAIKAGGKLLVVDFKKENTPHGPPLEMRLTGYDVIRELQQVGFSKIIIDVNSLPYQYIISAKKAEDILPE